MSFKAGIVVYFSPRQYSKTTRTNFEASGVRGDKVIGKTLLKVILIVFHKMLSEGLSNWTFKRSRTEYSFGLN